MSNKQLLLWLGGAFTLMLLGSIAGASIYAHYFAPRYAYLPPQPTPATFSHFTDHADSLSTFVQTAETKVKEVDADAPFPHFVRAASVSRPAVVHIKSSFEAQNSDKQTDFFSNPFREFFEDEGIEAPQSVASGSGVLISADGYIATNNHVIQDASSVNVTLFDNRTFPARVIGTDLSTDLALLKIEGQGFPNLSFGDSDNVQVGEWVLAVGNPMDLTSTVTAGIVSAKGRNIDLLRNDSKYAIESFIQTDAAVNKGNSGGALVNVEGQLIGINTAIASRTGYYAGYSFAIPASIAQKVMEDLLTYGEVRRGYLGVTIRPVNADLANSEHLNVLKGAYITDIDPNLGAYAAGMRTGDVIVSVNDIAVFSSSELQEQVSRYRPGDFLDIKVYRQDESRIFRVKLFALEQQEELAMRSTLEYRGAIFRLPTQDEYESLDIEQGVIVEHASSPLSRNGIEQGFVVVEINGSSVRSIEDLEKALLDAGEYVTMKGLYSEGMIASYSFNW